MCLVVSMQVGLFLVIKESLLSNLASEVGGLLSYVSKMPNGILPVSMHKLTLLILLTI